MKARKVYDELHKYLRRHDPSFLEVTVVKQEFPKRKFVLCYDAAPKTIPKKLQLKNSLKRKDNTN